MRLVLVLALLSSTAVAQLPPAPGAQIVQLTHEAGYANEPSIAINPRNPQQLVAAYQVNATVAYSRDSGQHWFVVYDVAPQDYVKSGDVSIGYDNSGHAILCYIAFDQLSSSEPYLGYNATRNGVFVRRSLDGGATWEANAIPVLAHPTRPGIPFEDKPYLVADTTAGPHAGNLYVGWTEFSLTKSVILFSRSVDGGQTWSLPIEISTHEGLPRDDNGSVEGFTGAVAPDGTLYAVWADGNDIAFTFSRDGGRTFANSRSIVKTAPPYFQVAGVSRANGFPQIAYGNTPAEFSPSRSQKLRHPRAGKRAAGTGLLYLVWSDYRNGDVDVFCSTSRDRGRSWSAPVRVNSDPIHNGADQFLQWLAVDPTTGAAYVIFYDRRGDPANNKAMVVLARSTDGGKTFTNYAWTKEAFEAREDFLGDYTALAALNGRVYGVWAEEEQPAPAPVLATPPVQPGEQAKPAPSAEANPAAGELATSAKPRHRTVLRVGIAEFSK